MLNGEPKKKPMVWNPHLGEDDFATAESVSDATDKIRILEARVKSLSNHAAATKRHAEMSDKHIQIEQGMQDLEKKHEEMRKKVKEEIRQFNIRKEDRIVAKGPKGKGK